MSLLSGGTGPFILQRLSAIYLAVYLCAGSLYLIGLSPESFAEWYALFAQSWFNIASLLFWFALLIHAWIGGRDIIMDYIHPDRLRFSCLMVFAGFLVLMALWAVQILLTVVEL